VVERRDAYRVVAPELVGKKPLGRSRRRWKYNTKMYLKAVGWGRRGALTEMICLSRGAGGGPL
jgi:hypothetical protein